METNQVNNPELIQDQTALPMMEFGEAIKVCWKKYFDFTGRARRSEYWWFVLFQMFVSIPCAILDGMLQAAVGLSFINGIASLLLFIPSMTVSFRRLHDIGRSGWWMGVSMILMIGGMILMFTQVSLSGVDLLDDDAIVRAMFEVKNIVLWLPIIVSFILCVIIFIFSLMDSHKSANKYGPSPKYQ